MQAELNSCEPADVVVAGGGMAGIAQELDGLVEQMGGGGPQDNL